MHTYTHSDAPSIACAHSTHAPSHTCTSDRKRTGTQNASSRCVLERRMNARCSIITRRMRCLCIRTRTCVCLHTRTCEYMRSLALAPSVRKQSVTQTIHTARTAYVHTCTCTHTHTQPRHDGFSSTIYKYVSLSLCCVSAPVRVCVAGVVSLHRSSWCTGALLLIISL